VINYKYAKYEYAKYCRRGLPVSTAVAAVIEDLTDRTSFFNNEKE
jgi:hypothetical protein